MADWRNSPQTLSSQDIYESESGYASETFDDEAEDAGKEGKEEVADALQLDITSPKNTTKVPGQSPTGYESEQFDEAEDEDEDEDEEEEEEESSNEVIERKVSEGKSGEASLSILEQPEEPSESTSHDSENVSTKLNETELNETQDQEEKTESVSIETTKPRKKVKKSRKIVKRSRRRGGPGKRRSASAVGRRGRGQSVPKRTASAYRRKSGDEYEENDDEEEGYEADDAYHSGGGGGESAMFRTPSAHIMAKKFVERNIVKKKLLDDRTYSRQVMLAKKKEQQDEWAAKMRRSPFKIDLVAENERLEEELRIRIKQEERRQKQFERQEQKLKNDVLVQALHQATDLDVLRAEKRMILLEEKRLHALMGVEKSKSTKKNDMMAAMRAEKQRRAQKLEFRRQQRMLAESRYQEAHAHALLEKLGLDALKHK